MKRTIFMMFVASISFFSCSDDDSSSDDNDDMTDVGDTMVTYTNDVAQIISSNCLECHGETLANGAPISLHTFELMTSNINSVEFRINDMVNPMPPQSRGGLMTEEERAVIDDWISGGLLEN